ncbi:hypothetical protein [Pseudoalteromonas luteoviolacea]|uniref:Uncharacterized protein n=1 Tax=Pseudoalteromonas luteoviolacea NCIMB 1942 TaxID=1365253 RepID=A0A167E163_9GAMM|nr:hypothetical protein [Pseudoalteromonas luteoviolacea]KZN49867.1 hypothetical protein N482_25265 [Pseudoalteromonas luteoviolacea NCIMB 1942]
MGCQNKGLTGKSLGRVVKMNKIGLTVLLAYFTIVGNVFSCEDNNDKLNIFMRSVVKLNGDYSDFEIFTQKKFNGYYLKGFTLELKKELIVDLEFNESLEFSGNYYQIEFSMSDKNFRSAYIYLNYSRLNESGNKFITCIVPERYKLSELRAIPWN